MLTIIHGDDTATSRKYFLEEKQRHIEAPMLDGEKISLTDLAQIFDGGELFSSEKTLFIENFLSKKKKSAEKETLSAALQTYGKDHHIFLWEGKELDRSVFNQFKTAVNRGFKLPQTLFQLVENVKPGNGKELVNLFQKTIQTTEPEMVFFMLVRQVRLLLGVLKPADQAIDEIKRMQDWQATKLRNQARLFSEEQLLSLYNKLFIIESGQKTGTLASPLPISIDFLLLEI